MESCPLFQTLIDHGTFSGLDRANALYVAEVGGWDEVLKIMIESPLFDTGWRAHRITFGAALLDDLVDELQMESQLEHLLSVLPELLNIFALKMANLSPDSRYGAVRRGYIVYEQTSKVSERLFDLPRSYANIYSDITSMLKDQWLERPRSAKYEPKSLISWHDRLNLLGPRMIDDFPEVYPDGTKPTTDDIDPVMLN